MSGGNGRDIELGSAEERAIAAAGLTAVLLLRLGRDGRLVLSGDAVTAGDEMRVLGILEKCKQAVGPICAEVQKRAAARIVPPPQGLRLS